MSLLSFSANSEELQGIREKNNSQTCFRSFALGLSCFFFISFLLWFSLILPSENGDACFFSLCSYTGVKTYLEFKLLPPLQVLKITQQGYPSWSYLFFGILILSAFTASYFASIAKKIPIMIGTFWVAMAGIYGVPASFFFLYLILAYYLFAHCRCREYAMKVAFFFALGLLIIFAAESPFEKLVVSGLFFFTALGSLIFRRLEARYRAIQIIVPLAITIFIIFYSGAKLGGEVGGSAYSLTYYLFLSFFLRMLFHYVEQRDGLVPEDLSFKDFLCLFSLMPDFITPEWWYHPGQGLAYLSQSFYQEDKNRLILKGVKSVFLSTWYYYLVIPLSAFLFEQMAQRLGFPASTVAGLYDTYLAKQPVSIWNLWLVSLNWMVYSTSILVGGLHFKVGLHQLFGFNIQRYTRYPWISTSLPEFWRRFGYHYMQLILRGFFLPAFFRLSFLSEKTRIFLSLLYALFVGQMITFGFVILDSFDEFYKVVPYFFVLLLGIGFSFLLSGDRQRKPWTVDRYLPLDLFRVSMIISFGAFAHLFVASLSHTGSDKWVLNLILAAFKF